ncbi:hypothetical protein B0H19DRAFT_1072072 [Mycena capillaripes]|nr:hypothetical protein B0H19DRAFT_1072072 [Mycena capillaripes]
MTINLAIVILCIKLSHSARLTPERMLTRVIPTCPAESPPVIGAKLVPCNCFRIGGRRGVWPPEQIVVSSYLLMAIRALTVGFQILRQGGYSIHTGLITYANDRPENPGRSKMLKVYLWDASESNNSLQRNGLPVDKAADGTKTEPQKGGTGAYVSGHGPCYTKRGMGAVG